MAEPLRNDEEQLTTADLAGKKKQPESARRPELVRDGEPAQLTNNDIANPTTSLQESGAREETKANAKLVEQPTALFADTEVGEFRNRWNDIQTGFVDEPRRAVEQADNLVALLMTKLAEGFANERSVLEKQWDRGDDVSTEDLRVALQRYRTFFDRLLKV